MVSIAPLTSHLHSHRRSPAVVTGYSGPPCTKLYLISHPLPSEVTELGITTTSSDQGYYDDLSQGRWSWFEIGILRPLEPDQVKSFALTGDCRSVPEDFRSEIESQGHPLLPLRANPTDLSAAVTTWRLHDNDVGNDGVHKVTWSRSSHLDSRSDSAITKKSGIDLLQAIQKDDKIGLRASAQVSN